MSEAKHTPTLPQIDTPLIVEAGRVFSHNGVALYSLHRCGNDSEGYAAAPWEADLAAHEFARCVNAHEALVAALDELHDRAQYFNVEPETLAKAREALRLAEGGE